MNVKIAVIGAGNVGCALAGIFSLKGYKVNLYAHKDHSKKLEEIKKNKKIQLKGVFQGEACLNLLTTDLMQAVNDANIIFITVPAHAHEVIFKEIYQFLKNDQIIFFMPGNFATLTVQKIMNENKIKKDLIFVETSSVIYPCRSVNNGQATILTPKKKMDISIVPKEKSGKTFEILKQLFECPLFLQENALIIGLITPNGVVHPGAALLNIGRIEFTKGNFYFYGEGMTDSVCKVLEKIDQDRLKIGNEFGFKLKSLVQLTEEYYQMKFSSIKDFAMNSKIHNSIKASPENIQDRYFIEDIPFILVPWFLLGQIVGVHSKTIEAIINLASVTHGVDFFEKGRNLKSMGLEGFKKGELLTHVSKYL